MAANSLQFWSWLRLAWLEALTSLPMYVDVTKSDI